jgi:hypothetical protein
MSNTPDQEAAEKIGRAIDGQIFRLGVERATLLGAAARITEIDAELAILQVEKSKIDSRRPPKSVTSPQEKLNAPATR